MSPQRTQTPTTQGAPEIQRQNPGAEIGDTSLAEALATLRKRLWILILAVCLGGGYGFYKAYTQPRVYSAISTIQVHNGASAEYKLDAATDYGSDSLMKMNTQVAILKSATLLFTVAREMDLANNPEFSGPAGSTRRSLSDPSVRAQVVGQLQTGLQVNMLPRTELMQIAYASLSAKLASDIVNQVVLDYIHRSYQTPVEATEQVSTFLSQKLEQLRREVEASQKQMMDLQRKLGVLGYDSTKNQLSASLEGLLTAEGAAKIARIDAESRYHMVAGMDVSTLEGSIEVTPGTAPGELNALRSQIIAAKTQFAQLAAGGAGGGLLPKNPTMLALQAQIDTMTRNFVTEQNRMLLQSKEAFLAAKAAETDTERELDDRKNESYNQGDNLVQYTLVQREFEQNRSLYDGLQQRLRTAELQAGLDAAEVDVIDPALPPVNPVLQPTSTIVLTNAVFALLGSIVLVFILESLDTNLHNIAEIETVMELPSLAIIPRSKRSPAEESAGLSTAQRNINVLTQPKSQFTEAFRSLRTSLMLATAGHPPKLILFTSATPSEGKTTTASNLACILAQGDARVLLIDADLRRPNVHHRFGLSGKIGLTSVLAGNAPLEDAVVQVAEVPNLDVMPSGPVPPFPTEMLGSDAMHALMERLSGIYTHIVIDSPPILSVTDGVILARSAEAVVLVIRHGKSSKHVIRRARDLLLRSGAPMAGLVLNAVDLNSPDYYGYYGYSNYSYGTVDADSWESQGTSSSHAGASGKGKR